MNIESCYKIPSKPSSILKSMSVGDSILVDDGDSTTSKIYMVARLAKKRWGMQFVARTTEEGLRIWRVK